MTHGALLDHISALLDREGPAQGALAHARSGLHFLRFAAPTGPDAAVYRPLLCLVLQGAKEVGTSRRTLFVATDNHSLSAMRCPSPRASPRPRQTVLT